MSAALNRAAPTAIFSPLTACIAATLVISSLTAVAAAQSALEGPEQRAAQLVEVGLGEARAGQFKDAAIRFEQALKLFPHPEIAHNLARAQQELKLFVEAISSFRQALKMDPEYIYAADARERITSIDQALRKTHAVVTFTANTPGITFDVSDSETPVLTHRPTPTEVYLPAGVSLRIDAKLQGFLPSRMTRTFAAGEESNVELVLRPLPKKGFLSVRTGKESRPVWLDDVSIGQTPIEGLPVVEGTHSVRVGAPPNDVHRQEVNIVAGEDTRVSVAEILGDNDASVWSDREVIGLSLAGSGGLGVIIGIPLFVLASERAYDARTASQMTPSDTSSLEDLDAEYHRVRGQARALEAGAWLSTLLGVGLASAGLVLFYLEEEGEDVTTWVPQVGATSGGVSFGASISF